MINTSQSILFSTILLILAVSVNFHYYKQEIALNRLDSACVNLFNGLGDSTNYTAAWVALYRKGQLKKEYAEGYKYAEKMHGVTVEQCINR